MFTKLIPCFVFTIGIDICVLPKQTDGWKGNRTCESHVLLQANIIFLCVLIGQVFVAEPVTGLWFSDLSWLREDDACPF